MHTNDQNTSLESLIQQHLAAFQDVESLKAAVCRWLVVSDRSLQAFDQALQEQIQESSTQTARLREELGQTNVLPETFDQDDLSTFWGDVDALSDQMLSGNLAMRDDSAALPLQS